MVGIVIGGDRHVPDMSDYPNLHLGSTTEGQGK